MSLSQDLRHSRDLKPSYAGGSEPYQLKISTQPPRKVYKNTVARYKNIVIGIKLQRADKMFTTTKRTSIPLTFKLIYLSLNRGNINTTGESSNSSLFDIQATNYEVPNDSIMYGFIRNINTKQNYMIKYIVNICFKYYLDYECMIKLKLKNINQINKSYLFSIFISLSHPKFGKVSCSTSVIYINGESELFQINGNKYESVEGSCGV